MSFDALVIDKDASGTISVALKELPDSALPDGNVTVRIHYSCLNYKDALCLTGAGNLVGRWPHVPGIDFSGIVETSKDSRYRPGDAVILTGWRVGETWWGGYAQRACVNADWLVPLPPELDLRQAMILGTAGLTAMLALERLEQLGLAPQDGEVLVTGAAGGVGSLALTLLTKAGYNAAALTGRTELADYLTGLGARRIVDRAELGTLTGKPLESQNWAGAIDTVGGVVLARVLAQMKAGACVAAIGLAGGAQVPATVIPFLLRGISLLGIDSVMKPFDARRKAWARLASIFGGGNALERLASETQPGDLPRHARDILAGRLRGRLVVRLISD